jgi:hypothetical protein
MLADPVSSFTRAATVCAHRHRGRIHGLAPVKPDGKDSPREGVTVRQHQNGSGYLDTSGDDAERLGKSRKKDKQVDQQAAQS